MADLLSISASLANKTPAERTQIKANTLAVVKLDKFELRGFSVVIKELTTEKDMLKVVVLATKDGKEIFPDNPLYFRNPPFMVPDGTYRTVNVRDRKTGEIKEKQIPNFVENPTEALKEIIIETLEVTT